MTSQVIETKEVKVQASPVPHPGLTPLAVYTAICEVTEYTSLLNENGQSQLTEHKSIGNIYIVIDDNGETQRFGDEFFRQV